MVTIVIQDADDDITEVQGEMVVGRTPEVAIKEEEEEKKKKKNKEEKKMAETQTNTNWRKHLSVRRQVGMPMFRSVEVRYSRAKTKQEDMSAFTHEERFMAAVRDGDVSFVEEALDKIHERPLNINCVDRNDRTAVSVSIIRGNLLILKLLLKHNAAVGDSLLRAVDTQFFEAVKLICKHSESYGDRQMEVINCRSKTDDYHPEITPIILACHHNNFEIIDILLKYGALVPSPDSSDSERTAKHTLQRSVGTLNIYRALSSQFYISKTSKDPIGDAFHLCHRLREMSGQEYEFRSEYLELADSVEEYAADLLGQARDSTELNKVMTQGHSKGKKKQREGGNGGATLEKVFMAISYTQKKFVAHPHCQQLLIKRFFGSMAYTRDWPFWKQMIVSLLIMISYPFISIAYIFVPAEKINTFGDTPFIKFLLSVGSRLTFLLFLLIATSVSGSLPDDPMEQWTRIPIVLLFLILAWLVGMTWSAIKVLYRHGLKEFISNGQNVLEFTIIALFYASLILYLLAYLEVRNASSSTLSLSRRDLSLEQVREFLQNETVPELHAYIDEVVRNATLQIQADRNANLTQIVEQLVRETCNKTGADVIAATTTVAPDDPLGVDQRVGLSGTHPSILADALFAVATVIAFLRLLSLTVSSQLVGPLQISLGGMLFDIGKFILVFIIVWFAFALGLNQIYQTYESYEYNQCVDSGEADCPYGAFMSVGLSMMSLFWSLFGLESLSIIQLSSGIEHYFTEAVGTFLFALYLMFAVVVMLNALIAMMSNTYTRVEENSDTEWKYARAQMWVSFLQPGGTTPPPFNIFPTIRDLIDLCRMCGSKCCRKGSEGDGHKKRDQWEEDYVSTMKQLVERYILDQTTLGADSDANVTRSDIMAIRNDIAVFRYETFKSLKASEVSFTNLKGTLGNIQTQLDKVDVMNTKTSELDQHVRDVRRRTTEIHGTVDGIMDNLTSTLTRARQSRASRGGAGHRQKSGRGGLRVTDPVPEEGSGADKKESSEHDEATTGEGASGSGDHS
ncbi:short transient receptor potential channel 1-like [Diadema antillarum]|uniref:short transient receptor potential channel 1-like n=1 Tax=Diadema antillarum TaxID=105358 RepID=UPI003A89E59D